MGIGEISGNLDEMIKENLPVASCYRNQLNEPIESTQPYIALQQLTHSFFSINTCHLGKVVIFLLNTSAKILESRFLSTAVAPQQTKESKASFNSFRLSLR